MFIFCQVNFSLPLSVISERCDSIQHLDLTFATDTLLPTRPVSEREGESFNLAYMRDCLSLIRVLASHNNIKTLKLLLCNKQMLQEISKCSKLTVLEIIEASVRLKNQDFVKLRVLSPLLLTLVMFRNLRDDPKI